jgi:hypothetical protein
MSGVIVLDGKISKLPYPVFPRFKNPYGKGFRFQLPPTVGTISLDLGPLPSVELELIEITFMQSGFDDRDNWTLTVNGGTVLDTVYTKELGQVKTLKGVKRIGLGEPVQIQYHNESGTSKVVWVDIDCMAKDIIL